MNKIIEYLTKHYATVLGMTVLTGLTVTSSATGVAKITNNMQAEGYKPTVIANAIQVTPSPRQGTTSTDSEGSSVSERSGGECF